MARPQKNADARRSRHIIFRLTDEEYDRLDALAQRTGLPPNELARRFTRRGGRKLVVQTSRRCDPAFLKRIDQIGHNLNQLVKNAHIFGRVSPRLQMLCDAIEQIVTLAMEDSEENGS